MSILKLMIFSAKTLPDCMFPHVIKALLPAYNYFNKRQLAKWSYQTELNNQMRIAWGYDGAFECEGRDSDKWIDKVFSDLSFANEGSYPPRIVIDSILSLKSTPKMLRFKVLSMLWVFTQYSRFKQTPLWQHYSVAILYTTLWSLL